MRTPDAGPEGDLSPLERRLASCRPTAGGPDRDATLYLAGAAAARASSRGRAWAAAAAALALVAVVLGARLGVEYRRRLSLEMELARVGRPQAQPAPSPAPESVPQLAVTPPPTGPAPASYLVLGPRALAAALGQDPHSSADRVDPPGGDTPRVVPPPAAAPPPILRARGSEGLLNL